MSSGNSTSKYLSHMSFFGMHWISQSLPLGRPISLVFLLIATRPSGGYGSPDGFSLSISTPATHTLGRQHSQKKAKAKKNQKQNLLTWHLLETYFSHYFSFYHTLTNGGRGGHTGE